MQRFYLLLLISFLGFMLLSCQPRPSQRMVQVVPSDPVINESLGKLFLAKNKTRTGVYSFYSGLQYSIIKNGAGNSPSHSDIATFYYQGTYVDGRIFDNDHAQSNPISVKVSSLIPGLQEAITHMPPGSIWVVYIPSDLAYGKNGIPGKVGPNQTLIYTVHLLSFTKSRP